MTLRSAGPLLAFACLALMSPPASAQVNAEHAKLDYFIGHWRSEVDVPATATTPASHASGTDHCEWFANMHVVCKSETNGPAGSYRSTRIISYVPQLRKFTSYAVDSLGYALYSVGEVRGDAWVFQTELAGVKSRFTMRLGVDAYTAISEWAGPSGWVVASEGHATRTGR